MICKYCNGTGTSNTCVNGTFKPCAACNGTGEDGEEIKEKITNFDRITASPEALVRWVSEITDFCDRGCSHCPVQEKCLYDSDGAGNKDNDELLLEWFNEESKE